MRVQQRQILYIVIFLLTTTVINCGGDELNESNFDETIKSKASTFVYFYSSDCGTKCYSFQTEFDRVVKAYEKFSDKVNILQINCDENPNICRRENIGGYPSSKWYFGNTFSEFYTGRTVAEYIVDFINSNTGLRAKLGPERSYVLDIHPDNFTDVIKQPGKDVMVEFYLTWCHYCRKFAPVYEELAKIFHNEPNVVIARFDADANSVYPRKYYVEQYPSLIWFDRRYKNNYYYEEGDSLPELVDFINRNSGTYRTLDGRLNSTFGLLKELNEVVDLWHTTDNKEDAASRGLEASNQLQHKNAKIYAKIFSEVVKNPNYIVNEISRLQKLIDSNTISSTKVDEFTVRINILSLFLPRTLSSSSDHEVIEINHLADSVIQ